MNYDKEMIKLIESLEEIIKARDSLIRKIQKYERDGPEDTEITMDPGPDVVYYCNLSYLSEICDLIQERIQGEDIKKLFKEIN